MTAPGKPALRFPLATAPACDHVGTERVSRPRTGHLWDVPAGVIDSLCVDCGAVVEEG